MSRVVAIVVLATGAAVAAAAFLVNPYVFQFYGDANSRLVQARMIVDAVSPGLHWIGSVWLPLPALLLLPFSLIDPLFTTGLAGLVVNLPLLAVASAVLYRWLRDMTGDRAVAAAVALWFALNPNTLYISMTAMTETATLAFVIAAVASWWRWIGRRRDPPADRYLLAGSLSAAAATLCRYEAWWLVVVGAAGLGLFILKLPAPLSRKIRLIAATSVSGAGMTLWLLWNWVQVGDPLHFHRAEYYSAAWQALRRGVRATYVGQWTNSLGIYATTMVAVFGYVFLAAAAVGTWQLARRRPRGEALFLAAVLLVMPVFTIVSLYLGVAEMTRWWNSRYVLLCAPFLSVVVALAFARWRARPGARRLALTAFIVAAAATTIVQGGFQRGRVVTVADAAGGFYYRQTPGATAAGERLRREWQGGRVLCATGSAQAHRIMQASGIATRHFVIMLGHDRRLFDLKVIGDEFTWVVVGVEPDADGAEAAAFLRDRHETLARDFALVHEHEFYRVYRRR